MITEKRKEYLRQWAIKNKEKLKVYRNEWHKNNKDKVKKSNDKWYEKNKKTYYEDNKERILSDTRAWRKTESGKISSKKSYEKTKSNCPEKNSARLKLRYAVKVGKIDKLPCEVCQTTQDVHGHHTDYNKPLEVNWLCRKHHVEEHNKLSN